MPDDQNQPPQLPLTGSQRAFREAPAEIKDIIKRVLQEERKVMHMQKRLEIHATVLEHVKRAIQ
jgi:hypothetical protein